MTLAEQLADFCLATNFDDLPPDVIAATKRMAADTLACAWAGTTAPGVGNMHRMVADEAGRPDAVLWGFGGRAPAAQAAFLNGVSAAALDFDCLHLGGLAHSPIVVMPAVMALAERERRSGREFLAALALGVELHCRLGMATTDHSGWFYTSMHGVLAAAAAAAKVLRLDREGVCNSIGAALAQCGGTQQAAIEQTLMKRTQSAIAARDAVFSALLARYETSAPRAVFEGKCGFYAMYENGDPAVVTRDLGRRYEVLNMTLKKFPSCGCNHAPAEAALQLMHENKLDVSQVKDIEVTISPYMARLVGAKYDPGSNPLVAAQFSAQYSVASVMLRGHLGLADLEVSAARDPAAIKLAHAVKVLIDESQEGAGLGGTVSFTAPSGRLTRTILDLPGSPENPMSDADLTAKALDCFSRGVAPLSAAQARALLGRIEALDQLDDMSAFWSGLAGVPAQEPRSA